MEDKKINIVHIIDHLGSGGAQKLLVDLAKLIDKEKYNMSIVILKDKNIFSKVLQEFGCKVHCVSNHKYTPGIKRLVDVLQKERPHIVHTHLFKANILGQYAAKKLRLLRVAHIHCTFNPQVLRPYFFQSRIFIFIYHFFLRQLLKGANRIIVINETSRKFLIERWGFQPAKVLCIPNGVPLRPFKDIQKDREKYRKKVRSLVGIKDEIPVIGMVGRFSQEKNWHLFFKTAAHIKKNLPESTFWAVGTGKELEFCKKMVKELGLKSAVHFWGYRDDIQEIYCGMDSFLFIPRLESFGLVLVEAMLSKLPVVAVNSKAAENIITHMQNGILVDSLDPETIATAMVDLLQDKSLQTRIAAQGSLDCSTGYDVKHWVRSIGDLYEKTIQTKG